MKREIKFRAYTHDNRMVYESFYSYFGSYGCVFNQFECEPKDLMQFTGLQDKNGKDIYEGDIIRLKMIDGFEDFRVLYSDDKARFVLMDDLGNDTWSFGLGNNMRIIGNIHENKDLL